MRWTVRSYPFTGPHEGNADGSSVAFRAHDRRRSVALTATLVAQGPPPPTTNGRAGYKNIKALKGTPANQLNQSMHLIKGALGVDCLYCHIEREWEKDTKPPKAVATQMISMVMDINRTQFGGRQVVTCYTCHNGRPVPADMPVFPVFEPVEAARPVLPAVDQILTRYVQALGGEQTIRKVTSRVITGTQYIPTGPGGTTPMPAMVERYQKAPNVNVTPTGRRRTISRASMARPPGRRIKPAGRGRRHADSRAPSRPPIFTSRSA